MNIVLFEDFTYNNFYPISLNRPTFSLQCGINTFADKLKLLFPSASFSYIIRDELVDCYNYLRYFDFSDADKASEYLFIKANVLLETVPDIKLAQFATNDDKHDIAYFKISVERARALTKKMFFEEGMLFKHLEKENSHIEVSLQKTRYLFDLVSLNRSQIIKDIELLDNISYNDSALAIKDIVVVGDRAKLFISPLARIYPSVCFMVDSGPILVDDYAIIKPFTTIEGPCYIGKKSIVSSAKIGEGTSIGKMCKIGGEVSNSIVMDFTNKNHAGFLGNSYVGSYVNIGALTTTSDLKNNYNDVIIILQSKKINTKSTKVGSFIGDHTKLGIGSLLNTGSVIGFGSSLYFKGQSYPKYVPSFIWGGGYPFDEYIFEDFISSCKKVLARREQVLTTEYLMLYMKIFSNERKERKSFFKKIS